MSPRVWLLVMFGIVNHELQLRAEEMKKTCAAHEKWTVFQRRKYGNVDFERGWDDYKKGFGDCDGDFWLGLETVHQLTKGGNMSLGIDTMTGTSEHNEGGIHFWAKYSHFRIGPESDNYRLSLSGYSGTIGDGLKHSNNKQFSTDDHNGWSYDDCASRHGGPWWYDGTCNVDGGLNENFNKTDSTGIWRHVWDARFFRLCCSEMKIYVRP